MGNLLSHIDEFYQSDKEFTKRMEELAKVFLFKGYINVKNKYHIYLRTVEFYYHEEDGKIKDPIMYHRDNYHIEGKIPYFQPLSFNSHDTGVDITFENEKKHIRASVLIRAYEVLDVKSGEKMVWNPAAQQFQPYKKGLPKYNTQSMYVKKFLNGFASSGEADITWENIEYKNVIGEKDITNKVRQGVFESTSNDRYIPKKGESDGKPWAFRREIDIELK